MNKLVECTQEQRVQRSLHTIASHNRLAPIENLIEFE